MNRVQRRIFTAKSLFLDEGATRLVLLGVMLGSIALLMIGLLGWTLPFGSQLQLRAGQVAPYDVVAPRQISYVSELLTAQARDRAASAVSDQYDSAEGRVRRDQVMLSRELLAIISEIRTNVELSSDQKRDALLSIADLGLSLDIATNILAASEEDWLQVVAETPVSLDRAMREEILPNTLLAAQRRVPSVTSSNLSEPAEALTVDLVRALIRPNSFFNEDRTQEMRQSARDAIIPQTVTLEQGEIILRIGDIATPEDVESLEQIGLLANEWEWWSLLRTVAFTFVILVVTALSIYRIRPRTARNYQEMSLLVLVSVAWLLAAKLMIVPHDWLPYLYPLAAMSMLLACLVDARIAIVFTISFALVVHYLGGHNSVLVVYMAAGGLLGATILGRAERLTVFLWAGLAVAVSNLLTIAAYRLPFDSLSSPQVLQLLLVVVLNGGLSASIALLGYFALGSLFGITTSLQLNELSRPTHPLLRQLLLKASGTYHHTIVVSNLAERGAATIGADALLARVGAYYHDIGKIVRPYFFTENMADAGSPHDKLDPLTSAQIIISHVTDGVDLAQKYRLPQRIQDFIREHHGTTLVYYFYARALAEIDNGGHVDEAQFRYPGPRPRSKETAVLMLADTCEAAVRSVRPATREDVAVLVNRLIDERAADGELSECGLTFKDLRLVKETFIQVLQGVHHPRISYPDLLRAPSATEQVIAPITYDEPEAVMTNSPDQVLRPGVEELNMLRSASLEMGH